MTKIMYNFSSHQNVRKVSLIDCRAKGGITGEDVRVINKTGRQVDNQGIDNHQIVDIPVGLVSGVNSQRRSHCHHASVCTCR